nr:hypothetical protein [Ensifer aridi]
MYWKHGSEAVPQAAGFRPLGGRPLLPPSWPVNALYGLHESLSRLLEEGLETSWARHRGAHDRLVERLHGLGVAFVVDKEHRLPQPEYDVDPGARGGCARAQTPA